MDIGFERASGKPAPPFGCRLVCTAAALVCLLFLLGFLLLWPTVCTLELRLFLLHCVCVCVCARARARVRARAHTRVHIYMYIA